MLDKVKQFFSAPAAWQSMRNEMGEEQANRLAAAALMVEIIAVDYQQKEEEKQALITLLQREFDLGANEAEELFTEARHAREQATDYYRFVEKINRHYSAEQKIDLIEMLWRLAWVDKEIHQLEEHVIRRLASLLYVSHKDFIAAKLRVLENQLG